MTQLKKEEKITFLSTNPAERIENSLSEECQQKLFEIAIQPLRTEVFKLIWLIV